MARSAQSYNKVPPVSGLVSHADTKLTQQTAASTGLVSNLTGGFTGVVIDGPHTYSVDMQDPSNFGAHCECGFPCLFQLPCAHMIALHGEYVRLYGPRSRIFPLANYVHETHTWKVSQAVFESMPALRVPGTAKLASQPVLLQSPLWLLPLDELAKSVYYSRLEKKAKRQARLLDSSGESSKGRRRPNAGEKEYDLYKAKTARNSRKTPKLSKSAAASSESAVGESLVVGSDVARETESDSDSDVFEPTGDNDISDTVEPMKREHLSRSAKTRECKLFQNVLECDVIHCDVIQLTSLDHRRVL